MTKPRRIQLRRAKGWRMPPNTVVVSRPSKWGNPFIVGKHGTAEECVRLFTLMCGGLICLTGGPEPEVQQAYIAMAKRDIHELRGKNVGCWCREGKPCHGDPLMRIARTYRKENDNG